jgi:hypothetical protein
MIEMFHFVFSDYAKPSLEQLFMLIVSLVKKGSPLKFNVFVPRLCLILRINSAEAGLIP